jgi:hypothetical protein
LRFSGFSVEQAAFGTLMIMMDAGEHRAVLQTETLHTNLTVPIVNAMISTYS